MFSTHTRHWIVGFGLGAVALVTGASAASFVNHAHRAPAAITTPALPVVSGDLGEVIVTAPGDLGEVIVRAPADLGEVLVEATRITTPDHLLAEVTVTAPRFEPTPTDGAALVAAQ